MPTGKIRGILREYLQILILKEMTKDPVGKKLFFTGGTALRLVHLTKRFSEDLDFHSLRMKSSLFEEFLKRVCHELQKGGFANFVRFRHRGKLLTAGIIFPDVEKYYQIKTKYTRLEGIVIKVEADSPKWVIQSETFVISGFGQMFPVICTNRSASFADKIDALIQKNRARHLFDIIYMLSKQYPVDKKILKKLGVKESPMEAIANRVKSFSLQELKKQADQLRPFLFDESEAELLEHAHTIIPQLIGRYNQ